MSSDIDQIDNKTEVIVNMLWWNHKKYCFVNHKIIVLCYKSMQLSTPTNFKCVKKMHGMHLHIALYPKNGATGLMVLKKIGA